MGSIEARQRELGLPRRFTSSRWHSPFRTTLLDGAGTADDSWWLIEDLAFSKVAKEHMKLHHQSHNEFAAYVRIARDFDRASMSSSGLVGALPLYYSVLNLAKAELIGTTPGLKFDRIGHGLSFDPRYPSGLKVSRNGVFRLLYETRMGRPIAPGTKLPWKALIGHCPEIGTMFRKSPRPPRSVGTVQARFEDGNSTWTGLLVEAGPSSFDPLSCKYLGRTLKRHFTERIPPNKYLHIFGLDHPISRRYSFRYFEAKDVQPFDNGRTDEAVIEDAASFAHHHLWPYFDYPLWASEDARLVASLYQVRDLPMTTDLARYAAIYYLSSLVRYSPGLADRSLDEEGAVLWAEFLRSSRPLLIKNAVDGLFADHILFQGAVGRRG